ncbi:Shikimate dehydrogenase substrate binding domain protein [Stackebrandtia nassauensis DSM 44728]|uniref:Shikimate dehydrogenase substrate binding domain protein n=1 Tax=Stackebrandtia nassauensis (strain DSM 44728 / CIP 108903 / NRRL B-16338 / NBRC 102104 / LLR-40K-21) TaxID=446470 RepID=D3PYU7_STANL|nr:shikimate dehydrogenase [Stackebrandtia nassauensis]ADD43530.1 Shikimate dehydrogenase substrate binding domain protein [Stackebrandtia nassauensis DSM 44728]
MTRRAAVVGSPIAHSLSPAIHNAGYAAAGLSDWTYTAHECGKDTLASFLDSLGPEWAGLSVTMPLKERALALADSADDTATALGAANTLVFGEGGRVAYNTDAPGMVDALAEVGMRHASRVAILGAGGTARAALGAAASLSATSVTVYARRPEAVAELEPVAQRLGLPLTAAPWESAEGCGDADLVVSTMPKGVSDALAIDWKPDTVAFDVVYDPWPTEFARLAQAAGCRIVSGLSLLLWQAVVQFRLFTGVDAPVEAMRAALPPTTADLSADHSGLVRRWNFLSLAQPGQAWLKPNLTTVKSGEEVGGPGPGRRRTCARLAVSREP